MKKHPRIKRALSGLLAVMMALVLSFSTAATAFADDRTEELRAQKEEAENQLQALQAQIKEAQETQDQAANLSEQYAQQSSLISSQIAMLGEQKAYIENEISIKEMEIEEKQAQVDIKQMEYDQRWEDFKQRMGAMQMLNDGGSIALLSSATNLYQLLTFAQTLEQITSKDQEICEELENERTELEAQKADLETAKQELEANRQALEENEQELSAKNQQLIASKMQADATLSQAEAEEAALEEAAAAARRQLDEAASALDAYLNAQVAKYGSAAITCSLNFGPALPSYRYISCYFGVGGHRGTDFAAPGNTPIYAIADGIVTDATYHYSWGNYVQVYHGKDDSGNTYSTLYAHMISAPSVGAGQTVTKGQLLGYVGSTGNSTGNHLHLEMKVNNVLTNVTNYIPH